MLYCRVRSWTHTNLLVSFFLLLNRILLFGTSNFILWQDNVVKMYYFWCDAYLMLILIPSQCYGGAGSTFVTSALQNPWFEFSVCGVVFAFTLVPLRSQDSSHKYGNSYVSLICVHCAVHWSDVTSRVYSHLMFSVPRIYSGPTET